MGKPTPPPVTVPGRTEQLFTLEARLRAAAENYATWVAAPNAAASTINGARAQLRDAAISYANVVRLVG